MPIILNHMPGHVLDPVRACHRDPCHVRELLRAHAAARTSSGHTRLHQSCGIRACKTVCYMGAFWQS